MSKKETVTAIEFDSGKLFMHLVDASGHPTRTVDADGWPQGTVRLLSKVMEGRLADLQREANDALSRTPKPRLQAYYTKKT